MSRYLKFDATPLLSEAIYEIMNARDTKKVLSILTRIYKISRQQDYLIDPFLLKVENQTMDTPYLKSYYHQGSISLTSEQIEIIRMFKGKVPKYRIIREFHINENQVNDIWKNHERQQQVLHLEFTTFLNKEIKKRSFKSNSKPRTKSICISNPISNMVASTLSEIEKINNEDLGTLYEKEARKDEKNKTNMTRLLAT
ncbi:hypothetical protein Glove_332g58 [Diversispora epigaea]|uniref:Uncharacterized protein n=1 Tax=Diversispora epigaea TaxID=1348612 RepID=A0A397HJ06_9GLOM|nr:hypothetical protein Glove_332g58 [Diversispora epigaea]